jgi:uncharacterized RDD family membrane protein YckC
VYLPLVAGAIFGGVTGAAAGGDTANVQGFEVGMGLALLGFMVWLGITIKFMKDNGQSIGKKLCAIKVVRPDGSTASLSRLIWLRNVVNGLFGLIPLYGIVEVLFIFGNARRCLHDHLADTIVIKA